MSTYIVAHRGARTQAPENSRSAFDKALACDVDGLELDVQLTKDNIPVLFHDRTIKKITGRLKHIADYSYNELSKNDWGAWYDPAFQGEPLLTLKKTLDLYCRRTQLFIEIKSRKRDQKSGRSIKLTELVLKELESPIIQKRLNNIFILSFDPDVLKYAYTRAPKMKYVLNLSHLNQKPTGHKSIQKRPLSETKHLYGLCVKEKLLTQKLSDHAHKIGKKIMTYTCNIPRQLNKALSCNVDVIMTDRPEWLVTKIEKYQ